MRFTFLELTGNDLLVAYIVGGGIAWILFYYTIKGAVKWGNIEALEYKYEMRQKQAASAPDKVANAAQEKLQQRYDKGQISFEEYKAEWEKLS